MLDYSQHLSYANLNCANFLSLLYSIYSLLKYLLHPLFITDLQHGDYVREPGHAGRLSGQWWGVPHIRCAGAGLSRGQGCAQPHAQLRHVQLQWTVCLQGTVED